MITGKWLKDTVREIRDESDHQSFIPTDATYEKLAMKINALFSEDKLSADKLMELKKRIGKYPAHTPLVWEMVELIDILLSKKEVRK